MSTLNSDFDSDNDVTCKQTLTTGVVTLHHVDLIVVVENRRNLLIIVSFYKKSQHMKSLSSLNITSRLKSQSILQHFTCQKKVKMPWWEITCILVHLQY